jgi:hypothetical protein
VFAECRVQAPQQFGGGFLLTTDQGDAYLFADRSNDRAAGQRDFADGQLTTGFIEESLDPGDHPTSSASGRGKLLHPDAVSRRRSAPS